MALFKVNRGNSSNLPATMTDGWAYFCTDTAEFFIDYADENGDLHRKKINAKDAETIGGVSLDEAMEPLDPYLEYWWIVPEGYQVYAQQVEENYSYTYGSSSAWFSDSFNPSTGDYNVTVYYGDSFTFNPVTGKYTIENPVEYTDKYTTFVSEAPSLMLNKFVAANSPEANIIMYFVSGTTIEDYVYQNMYNDMRVRFQPQNVTRYYRTQVDTNFVSAETQNAYSEDDGFIALGTIKDKVLDLALEAESTPKYDVVTALNNSETEIPTSSAVYKAIETQTGMANVFATATIL